MHLGYLFWAISICELHNFGRWSSSSRLNHKLYNILFYDPPIFILNTLMFVWCFWSHNNDNKTRPKILKTFKNTSHWATMSMDCLYAPYNQVFLRFSQFVFVVYTSYLMVWYIWTCAYKLKAMAFVDVVFAIKTPHNSSFRSPKLIVCFLTMSLWH